ncbi:MAG: polysaccharide biosynthesis C-terminal domain-containing protein [Candidatus Eisenbacteria bacterium]
MTEENPSGVIQGEQKQYLSKVTKEAGFAFTGKVFGLLFGFFAQAVFARLLGADVLGVFVLGWTVVFGITILTTLGFEFSFVRFISKYESTGHHGEARAVFLLGVRVSVVAAVVGTIVMILLRTPLALKVFHEYRLESVLVWLALAVVPFSLMRVYSGALRALKDIRSFIIGFDVSHRVFRFVLFIALYYMGFRLRGIVVATIGATFLSAGLLAFFLWRRDPSLLDRTIVPAPIPRKDIVLYSSAMLTDCFLAFAMQHSGRIVIGIFLASADVGVYNIAALMSMLVLLVRVSFITIFAPVISDLYHRDRLDLLLPLYRSVTRWTIILSLPIYLWIVVAGEAMLGVFGQEFVRGYGALLLLSTGLMVEVCTGPMGASLSMTGHQKWNVYNAAALAVISVVLNVILVPRMGVTGAGLAVGLGYALVSIVRLIQVRFLLKISPYDRSSMKVGATVVIALVLAVVARRYLVIPEKIEWSFATAVASVAVVALLTFAMGIKEEDKLVLATVLRKLRRSRGGA